MTKRSITNSKSLREGFSKFYENVFSSCQIVISADDSFFWAGEYARFFGGLALMQKLPSKTMVGLEILNEKKFCFSEESYGYDPAKKNFSQFRFDYSKEIRVLNFLKEFWPTLDTKGKIKGFRIHILSESHCGGGLGSTGVVFACLAAALMILSERVDSQEISIWERMQVDDLMESNSFMKIFRLGWRLTAISRDGNSSGAVTFGAMINTSYPILFFSKNINKFLQDPTITSPENNLDNCKIIEEIPFWGQKIEEIFPLRVPQPWPIDIARVYSGALINTENIFKSLSVLKTSMEHLGETLNKELAPNVKGLHSDDLSFRYLFDLEEKNRKEFCFADYLNILNLMSIKILLSLKDLFLLGPDEEHLQKFTHVINQAQDFNHFMGHSTSLLDKICRRLSVAVASENEYNIAGVKIEGIGKGGHVLAVGPQGMGTSRLEPEIEKLSEETNKEISVDWASWIDGFGGSGLVVEQYLQNNVFSEFVTPKSAKVTFVRSGQLETKLISSSKIEQFDDYDLVLDCTDNKIYSKGQPLSSKELLSARTTIEIMKKLIHSTCCKIDNKQFGNSSYGQNRYDLQSKIFIPLEKALKKITGIKLDYKISGGVYDDYTVCLNLNNLNIVLLENIQ